MANTGPAVLLVWWLPARAAPPALPDWVSSHHRYSPASPDLPALIAGTVSSPDDVDGWPVEPSECPSVSAAVFRHRVGGRLGVDFLTGTRPVSLFGCGVDPDHEDEWNEYYDTGHFPGVVQQSMYVGGARYELHQPLLGASRIPPYLVVYELTDVSDFELLDPERMPAATRAEYERWLDRGAEHVRPPLLRLRAVPA